MSEYQTLQERIDAERIVKATANPRSFKQLGRNPQSLNFSLVIQRNLRWTDKQKSELIESALLGYPIPAVYAVKSNDNVTWVLDGRQRVEGAIIPFMRDELELTELPPVFGVDISGMKFSQLPKEFQEILEEERINVYQFEKLSPKQRDEFFRRMNNGTPLATIEVTRSILGEEHLEWIDSITKKPFFDILTENARDKFTDVEMVMQMLAVLKKDYGKLKGKDLQMLALDFRINNIPEELKLTLNNVIDYLGTAFAAFSEKDRKKVLKKNDIVGLVGAAPLAIEHKVDPEYFSYVTSSKIVKPTGDYKNTKIGGTNKADKLKQRISILQSAFGDKISKNEDTKDEQMTMQL